MDSLTSHPLFHALQPSDVELLASRIEQVDLLPGDTLFREGETGDALYVVRSGTLQPTVAVQAGGHHTLDTLGPGEIVGEMAVLYRRPRTATVRAITACSLLKIGAAALDAVFAANPSARARLLEIAARRLPSLYLASVPLFAGIDPDALRELDLDSNWIRLTGGQVLFQKGDAPDYVYVVARGRLEVLGEDADGHAIVARHLGHGDVVGEVAIFSGDRRNATVRAIRDSELIRLSSDVLHRLLERHPRGAIEVIRMLAARVEPVRRLRHDAPVSTIALIPAGGTPLPEGWAARLARALSGVGGATLVVDRRTLDEALGTPIAEHAGDSAARLRVAAWLHEQEAQFRFIVFECATLPDAWADFCLRQSDLLMFVAAPDAQPAVGELETRILNGGVVTPSVTKVLVRLHEPHTTLPTGTAAWLRLFPVARHHHVRIDRDGDYARVARFVAGTAVGLALSGGGARTLAHVGVAQALAERGIPIDYVAGVSAGVFTAAYLALGNDANAVYRLCGENMGNYNMLADATLPMVAFLSGKNLVRAVRKMYGDVDIEDLWLPFFCLSANLTTARIVVHDRGPLWLGIRATISVPGVEPPVCVNGELLVDGGVMNNLPVDVMRARCNGTVIASDVSLTADISSDMKELSDVSGWPLLWTRLNPFARREGRLPHILEILTRTATVGSAYHGKSMVPLADLYIRTPTDGVSLFDWKAGMTIVARARELALPALDRWQARERAAHD